MKEQIEELQNTLIGISKQPVMLRGLEYWSDVIAEALYNAGYRKQKEGEWVKATEWMRGDGEIYDYRCSSCNMLAEDGGYGNRDNLTKYCPNCGAHMRGGKNE